MKKYIKLFFALGFIIVLANSCSKKDSVTGLTVGHTLDLKAVGSSAKDLLTANTYTSLVIELQYMPGYPPDATSIDNLVAYINLLANKPNGVTVVQSMIPTGGLSVYTLNQVDSIAKIYRTKYTSGSQIAINFLYVDGTYSTDNVLGFAYRNTSMALFGKKLAASSGGPGQVTRTKLESTILEHETGHLFGLVNLGTPMQTSHEDATHQNHCNNSNCLMYWQVQTTGIMGPLAAGTIPTLDANCRADLQANGGK